MSKLRQYLPAAIKLTMFVYSATTLIPWVYMYVIAHWAGFGVPNILSGYVDSGEITYSEVHEYYFVPLKIVMLIPAFALVGWVYGKCYHFLWMLLLLYPTVDMATSMAFISSMFTETRPTEAGLILEKIGYHGINSREFMPELLSITIIPFLFAWSSYNGTYNKFKN